MKGAPAIPIADMDEKTWTLQAVGTKANPGLARMVGFDVYHTLRSKGSQAGWPDWACIRENDRMLFLELKTMKGKVSDEQKHWLGLFRSAGQEAWVARPNHFDALALVLQARRKKIDHIRYIVNHKRPESVYIAPETEPLLDAWRELEAALTLELDGPPPPPPDPQMALGMD